MRCSRCKVEKTFEEMVTGKTKCLECYRKLQEYYKLNRDREIDRAKKSINKDRVKTNSNKRYQIRKNPVSYMLWSIKAKAKKKGIPFDLCHDDILIPDTCPIFGIPLRISDGHSSHYSPSVDRIVPENGYVKGNIQIISNKANTIKNDASLEELEKLVDYLRRVTMQEQFKEASSGQFEEILEAPD